jgi:hypothetical protein
MLALGLTLVGEPAYAGFYKGMSTMQASQEITVLLLRGVDFAKIARAANIAGIRLEQVTAVLIRSGQDPIAVVTTLIKIDQLSAAMITQAALACRPSRTVEIIAAATSLVPQQRDTIIAKALTVPWIDPTKVLGATAAGRESGPVGDSKGPVSPP